MMLSKSQLITVAASILAVAVIARIEPAREVVFADKKFLGIF